MKLPKINMDEVDIRIVTLHKHWLTADAIKEVMLAEIKDNGKFKLQKELSKMAQLLSSS